MADVPHFDIPIRRDPATGHVAVVEQDSLEELAVGVEIVCRTVVGERLELPQFGLPRLMLSRAPIDLGAVAAQVMASAPRTHVLVEDAPEAFEDVVQALTVTVDGA